MEASQVAVAVQFTPSPQQADFFKWITEGTGSCVLEAVAGSGKTTTLIKALNLMKGSIFFGAYNKKIAVEIESRAPKMLGLTVSTMHAAGLRAWGRGKNNLKVNKDKVRDIYRDASSRFPDYAPYEGAVLSLVSYAKQAAVGALSRVDDNQVWLNLIEHFDVDCLDNEKLVIQLARKTLDRSILLNHDVIDFDDMIYAPLVGKCKVQQYDWVLIDEAQDTNASRRALALLLLNRGGRMVAVGDRHQAIYGFTGADADSLDLIAKSVNAVQMPLTVTYRCPKTVVTLAQTYVNHIQAHPDAPEGKVTYLKDDDLTQVAHPGDAILCRFNAPLIELVYQFISQGIPAKVEGRDIGNGLKVLVNRWKSRTYDHLLENLDKYLDREVAKFRAKEMETKAAQVEDKVNCLKAIVNRAAKIDPKPTNVSQRVCNEIDAIFGENVGKEAVLLSSIHKSKGREWKKVIWKQTGPSKWARMAWELDQENNLCYVAVTRAMEELCLTPL
jgi:superfamily I DNA/RNA helicase